MVEISLKYMNLLAFSHLTSSFEVKVHRCGQQRTKLGWQEAGDGLQHIYFSPITMLLSGAGQFQGARIIRIKLLSFNGSGAGEPSGTHTHTKREKHIHKD